MGVRLIIPIERRKFVAASSAAALAWPIRSRAQEPIRARLVGILYGLDDPDTKAETPAFKEAFSSLDGISGKGGNLRDPGRGLRRAFKIFDEAAKQLRDRSFMTMACSVGRERLETRTGASYRCWS